MIKGPRHFLKAKHYSKKVKEDDLITVRMQEWFTVLAADYAPLTPVNAAIRYYAVLGATGRVFESLLKSEDKMGQKIMPLAFLNAIRNTIYHAENPFRQLNPENGEFITFFSHLYEHFRQEIGAITMTAQLPHLLVPLDVEERQKPYFTQALAYVVSEAEIHRKKVKSEVQSKLNETNDTMIELIEHFQFQPGFLVQADTPDAYQRSNIIRSSAIGALLAWLSADAACILKGDFYLTKDDKHKSAISEASKKALLKDYAEFISAGKLYRYGQVSLDTITRRYMLGAESPLGLQLNVERGIALGKVELVKNLVSCWLSHPFVMNIEGGQDPIKGRWLIAAASAGCLPLVQYLFNSSQRNTWRAFSLTNAAKFGHEVVVKWILQQMTCSDELLQYSMSLAREHNQNNIVQLLESELFRRQDPHEKELLSQLSNLLLCESDEEEVCDLLDSQQVAIYSIIGGDNNNNITEQNSKTPSNIAVVKSQY